MLRIAKDALHQAAFLGEQLLMKAIKMFDIMIYFPKQN